MFSDRFSAFSAAIAATVVATYALGQKRVVVPAGLATTAGDGGGMVPMENHGFPFDVQCLFEVQPRMAGTVHAIAFRRGFHPLLKHDARAFTIDVEVGMSHSPISMYRPTPYLPAHRGNDYKTVFARRKVAFPAVSGRRSGPYPFTYVIVFDRPFVLLSGRTGMWEIRVENSSRKFTSPALWFDGVLASSDTRDRRRYVRRNIGRSCGPGTGDNKLYSTFVAVGTSSLVFMNGQSVWTGKTFSVSYAGARTDMWGPIRLPLDLGPFGAPGCAIYVSLDEPLPSVWLFSVSLSLLEIPNSAQFLGRKIYLQALVFNAPKNPLQLNVSQGIEALVGPRLQMEASTIVSPWPEGRLANLGVWGWPDVGRSDVFELRY